MKSVPKKKIEIKAGQASIKCFCGDVILIVPSVKVMSETIESHVAKHLQKVKDPKDAHTEAERIRDDLITKILAEAGQA